MELISRILLFVNIFSCVLFSQSDYLMILTNADQIKSDEIEFDVYIKSTGTGFNLTSYQCSFTCSPGNLSSPSFSYVPGTSGLTNFPKNGIGIQETDGVTELTFASSAGNDQVDTAPIRVGRFRLKSNGGFPAGGLQISWNFSGIINTILTGTKFTDITDPQSHHNLVLYPDTTSPKLLKVQCINIDKVILEFSEEVEQASALRLANYAIDNGISINDASQSPDRRFITLTTSTHTLKKIYTITVSNISDRAGNKLSAAAAQYNFILIQRLAVKLILQGPYMNGLMETHLSRLKLIPNAQPYNRAPWMYEGNEYADSVSPNVVDWILVELKEDPADSSSGCRTAAFLRNDGKLLDLYGNEYLTFVNPPESSYYLIVRHRNHLPAVSSVPIIFQTDSVYMYDFSSSELTFSGNNSSVKLSENIFGVQSGDADGNGIINTADYSDIWKLENGTIGYKRGDFDLNGGVNIADKNLYWKINTGKVLHIQ